MKNENTTTESERIAKAFNQLANAIGNLCKAIRKYEGEYVPKTAPLPNPKGVYESNIDQRIKEWVEAIEIWKNNLINKNSKTKPEPNDPLAGMHVDEKKFPMSAAYMAATFAKDEKVIEATIKAFDEAVKKYAYDDDETYPDYVCIRDVDSFYPTKKRTKLKFHSKVLNDVYYFWKSSCGYQNIVPFNFIKENPDFFREFETQNKILSKEVTNKFNDIYPDYVCIKDFGQMKVGDIIKYQWIENYNEFVYTFIDKQNMIINSTKEVLEKNADFFKKVEDKATTIYHDFICTKDYFFINGVVKKGTILKKFKGDYEPDRITSFYFFIDDKGNENLFPLSFLETNSEFFKIVYSFPFTDKEIKIRANKTINEKQHKFDLLKENQIITFTLKNGKTYTAQVLRDSTTKTYYLNSNSGSNAIYFLDLNQMDYKNILNKLYGNNDVYPSAPDLECLTNDLNTLIQLPDLSNKKTPLADLQKEVIAEQHTKLDEKFYKDQGLEFKCEELIEKFMPLVTKWKFEGNTIVNQEETYSGVWSYSDNNKRKAAIKIAILHCELLLCKIIIEPHFINTNIIKNKLEKMLSQ